MTMVHGKHIIIGSGETFNLEINTLLVLNPCVFLKDNLYLSQK